MALTTSFNVSPYYDDAAESKDFYRILFRPSYGLQARELTQLQTLLQYQIERGGIHFFENGSKVSGGDLTLDTKVKSLKLESAFSGTNITISEFDGKIIDGGSSGARGQVVKTVAETATDQPTLYVQLLSANSFSDGETITTDETSAVSANTTSNTGISGVENAQSNASIVSITGGVFFVDGFYTQCASQTTVVEKYSSTPTKRIGLGITESIVTSTDDSSLLDNATGTTNYAAPGANRFKLALTLEAKDFDATDPIEKVADEKFIELMRVENGEKTKEVKYPLYGELEKTLARRTFDESGDYTVRPFGLQLIANRSGNTAKISAGLEAGKAYIKGYEYETVGTTYIDVDKGRDSQNVSSFALSSDFGNKLFIHNVTGGFDVKRHEVVDLHCVNVATVNALTSTVNALTTYQTTKVGTARVRGFDFEQTDSNSSNTTHFHSIYSTRLYDVRVDNIIEGTADSASGGNEFINLPAGITSNVSGAYVGATLTVNTTLDGTTTSDTVTITDYEAAGPIHRATSNTIFSQNVLSNSTFAISFRFKDVQSLTIPHSVEDQSANANSTHVILTTKADVDNLSRYNRAPDGNTILSDTGRNSLIFKYPYTPIKSLPGGVTYKYKRFEQKTSDSSGTIDFTITTTGGSFVPGVQTLSSSEIAENYSVIVKSASGVTDSTSGDVISNGQILSFASGTNRNAAITVANKVTLRCNTSAAFTAEVVGTVQVANATPRTKSLVVGNVTATVAGTTNVTKGQVFIQSPNKTAGAKDNLMISDIFNLTRVIDSQDSTQFPSNTDLATSGKDITDRYILDNGQRDNFYDHGALILKPGAAAPTGRILAIVDYFDPDSNPGYFSIQSYNGDITSNTGYNLHANGDAANNFSYDTIPSFVSPITGETIQLRDSLDFRPVRANANNNAGANTVNDINSNTESLEISTSNDGGAPDPEFTFVSDIEYYLGRVDKVVLTRDRQFSVIKGVSDLNPTTPADDEDSMTLYTLQIPAYTFNIADIKTKYIDNRRYTMRDIGKLERRIENLEYYTSLTLLEKETAARSVVGEEGKDSLFNPQGSRFKNGILVDSFKGHSIGDTEDEFYQSSIDFDETELRPSFFSDNYRFYYNSSNSSDVNVSSNVATLNYTSTAVIDSPMSSNTFVEPNPYNLINYIGNLNLNPSSDTWFDTSTRPDVLVNLEGLNDAWQFGNYRNGHGSQWNDWSKIWSGVQINEDPKINTRDKGNEEALRRSAKLSDQVFSRTGIKQTTVPESIRRTVGNKVVDVSIIPFVRAHTIFFTAKGLKPKQNVSAFFDGTAANTTPASFITVSAIANTSTHFADGEIITQGSNTAQVLVTSSTTSSNTATIHFRVLSSTGAATSAFTTGTVVGGTSGVSATISGRTTPTSSTQANTNLAGEVAGELTIPAGTFRSGERLVRLTDNATLASATTFAEARYAVTGVLSSRESGVISTRLPISRREDIKSEDIVYDQSRRDTTSNEWLSPLSQTFTIDKSQHPNGIMVSEVDLYFRQKSGANTTQIQPGVTLQIRPVRNELPSPNLIIPFGEKTLRPEEVNAQSANVPSTSNSSHKTTFSFDAPVYLTPDDYALTIVTNSKEYQLYTQKSGEAQGGSTRRSVKQPNVGMLYKAQNASTPVADPEETLMFTIKRCEFSPTSGTLVLSSNASPLSGNTANVVADAIKVSASTLDFSNTSMTFSYRSTNTSGSTTASYTNIVPDQTVYLTERIMLEASTASDYYLKAAMSTSDSKVSPLIDLDRMNLITIENNVDNGGLSNADFYITDGGASYNSSVTATVSGGGTSNNATVSLTLTSNVITGVTVTSPGSGYVSTPTITIANTSIGNGTGATIVVNGETSKRGGNLNAKYLTRKVTLEDGFDASDIKVIINAYKPEHAGIHVYAKVLSGDDSDTMDDKNFFKLDQETSTSLFSINQDDVKEYIFKTTNDVARYTTDSGVTFDKFKSFIIKIGMTSTKTFDPPRIKDLRAIALDE